MGPKERKTVIEGVCHHIGLHALCFAFLSCLVFHLFFSATPSSGSAVWSLLVRVTSMWPEVLMIHVASILGTLAMSDDQRICIQPLCSAALSVFQHMKQTSALFEPSILCPALLFGLGVPIDSITSPNSRHCLFKMTSFRCLEASQVRAPSMVWLSHRCPESQHKNLNLLCDLTGCLGQMISKPSSSGCLTEKDNCLVLALLGDRFFFF